jgi:hypothetical protein
VAIIVALGSGGELSVRGNAGIFLHTP